jgi:hypothetical protein
MMENIVDQMKTYIVKYSVYKKEKSGKKSSARSTKLEPERRGQQTVFACDEKEAKRVALRGKRKRGLKICFEIDSISVVGNNSVVKNHKNGCHNGVPLHTVNTVNFNIKSEVSNEN